MLLLRGMNDNNIFFVDRYFSLFSTEPFSFKTQIKSSMHEFSSTTV